MSHIASTIDHVPPAPAIGAGMAGIIVVMICGLPVLAFAVPGALAAAGVYSLYHHKH